ncbi:MAG TPA: GNAT family N-acetyltransferase [Bacteroidia bacterium]
MLHLYTDRLRLVPLTLEQLKILSGGRNSLERSMGLILSDFVLNADDSFMEEFQLAIDTHCIPKVTENPDNYLWFTHWLIVHRSLDLTIGGIGVDGLPNESGEVMIGYYIDKKFEGQGLAAEALAGMIKWLFENESVKSIIADTQEDNLASQKVLRRNGFVFESRVDEGYRFRLRSEIEEPAALGI